MLAEAYIVEDVAAQRLVNALCGVHDFAQGARRLDRGDGLGARQAQFVGHTMSSPLDLVTEHTPHIRITARFPFGDARDAHTTQPQELVVLVPCPLEYAVHQIHAGLAVVGAGQQFRRPPQLESFLAVEAAQVDFHKITEAFVGQQNFSAGVDARNPRTPPLAFHHVDEARLRAARVLHHVEQPSNVVAARTGLEHDGVVRLLTMEVVVDPEVLLRFGEVYPFGIAERNERNLSRTT